MAFDAFLEVDGIPGESTDDKHADWIEVKSFNHDITLPISGSSSSGGGRASERADHGTFTIVKELDKASPKLALMCCNGTNIAKVTLELCRAGGDKQKYMVYELTDVVVQHWDTDGAPESEGQLPVEKVSFVYGKISWTYTQLDGKTGQPKGDISADWDQTTNSGG
ncbi:MAG: type VI secretion system tube protein Hcp [Planctomycetaceae bacterium]|nr:type VI secretion system tube protein Hcp [Planctomycetaceae bacterium]